MAVKAIFFDLDGTLLNTINDIKDAVNDALKDCGVPYFYDDIRKFIGNGAPALAHRALGEYDDEDMYQKFMDSYLPKYEAYQGRTTSPYPQVHDTLLQLAKRGVSLFVYSNKPDFLTQEIIRQTLGDIPFSGIAGHKEGAPTKPDPSHLLEEMKKHSFKPDECIMIGDSLPDLETAKNAGIRGGLCLWGYGKYDDALLEKADFLFKNACEWEALLS